MTETTNIHGTDEGNLTEVLPDMPVLIGALARARTGHPRAHLVTPLIEQCKNFDANPAGLRPRILRTIEAIERAA